MWLEHYQRTLSRVCEELGVEYVDLAPHFRRSWLRTYFREGMHWNANGHVVAADAISAYLKERGHI